MITLCEIGEVFFRLLDTNVFPCKVRVINIYRAVRTPCHQNLKYENFTSSFGGLRQRIAPMSVLHLQDDNFLIQPIKSLICNVVVAVGDRFFNSLLLSNWNARGPGDTKTYDERASEDSPLK